MRRGWAVRWREAGARALDRVVAIVGLVMGAAALHGIVDRFGIELRFAGEILRRAGVSCDAVAEGPSRTAGGRRARAAVSR